MEGRGAAGAGQASSAWLAAMVAHAVLAEEEQGVEHVVLAGEEHAVLVGVPIERCACGRWEARRWWRRAECEPM